MANDVTIQDGTVLADLESVNAVSILVDENERDKESKRSVLIGDLVDRVDESVSLETRNQLRNLLEKYSSIISTGETDLGRTGVVQHEIDTGDARPIRQALRRHPPAHSKAIQEHVSCMLQQGVIEPA